MNGDESRVADLLKGMTLEQKAGQLMMVGLDPTATGARYTRLTRQVGALLSELHIGGVVYFERNIGAPEELARLSADLQRVAVRGGSPGLLIAIDQEGGRVVRMREQRGYTEIPSAMALAATGDPGNAKAMAGLLARELRACGINMDLAPVLDVNNNPRNPVIGTRSFGADPQRVAAFGVAYLEGLQSAGVMAVGKHFPGHGDTALDSHYLLPVVPHGRGRLESVEFVPFRAAMRAGVAGIMSAHVGFPAIDPEEGRPATLSPRVMTRLLREEMGYDGLLLTDSLEMGALASGGYPVWKAAVAALWAGADLLCISHGFGVQREAHSAVVNAVRDGILSKERVDSAVRRVLAAKFRYGLLDARPLSRAGSTTEVGSPAARAQSRRVAEQAVTLVTDRAGLLPVQAGSQLFVVEFVRLGNPASGPGEPVLAARLASRFGGDGAVIDRPLEPADIASLVERGRGKKVVVATSDAVRHPWQVELVRALGAAGIPVIVVAGSGPYDLLAMPEVGTYLAIYGANPPMADALSAVLAGDAPATGVLPVRLDPRSEE